jgi:hypothetical protein
MAQNGTKWYESDFQKKPPHIPDSLLTNPNFITYTQESS